MAKRNNGSGLGRLFQDAVRAAASEIPEHEPLFDDDRILDAVRGVRPLTNKERNRLLFSAETQERFAKIRHQERKRITAFWEKILYETSDMRLLAAADGDDQVRAVRLEKKLCTIDLTPIDARGKEWQIAVTIAPEVIAELLQNSPRGIKVVDSEGEVWIQGLPDENGALSGYWQRDDNLRERLKRVSVGLRPL